MYSNKCIDLIKNKLDLYPQVNSKIETKPNDLYYFTYEVVSKEYQYYDIRKLIGMQRPDFCTTWKEAILNLPRRDNVESLNCNSEFPSIDFYTNIELRKSLTDHEDSWTIIDINNKGYVSSGHHRSTIAKVLNIMGVLSNNILIKNIEYHKVDFIAKEKYDKLLLELKEKYIILPFEITVEKQQTCKVEQDRHIIYKYEIFYKLNYGKCIVKHPDYGEILADEVYKTKYIDEFQEHTRKAIEKYYEKNFIVLKINLLRRSLSQKFKSLKRWVKYKV